ncbi:MAG: type IV pilus twitching motility protein PilT [Planctomycetota bacterium]|jgi:twitching motility protein PilT
MDTATLLETAIQRGASDIHLTPGRPVTMRVDGRLHSVTDEEVSPELSTELCRKFTPEARWPEVEDQGTTDFALSVAQGTRFRVSVMRQRRGHSAVLRLIPQDLLGLDRIGLPEACQKLLTRPRGLVLVTGPTGSGKSTTLAAMIDWINTNLDRHVITIEDPVEYFHEHKKSVITQREVGEDVPDFPEALRRALRQDPDVILVGEMRDLATISAAITAAETGHLVFGTLHTTGSARTVDRIIDAFPANQQEQIRAQLSVSIQAVISQVLLQRADGKGRVAAFEVMLMTPAVGNLIRKNETNKLPSTIQTSRRMGMITLDDHLLELVRSGDITVQTALDAAQDRADLEVRLG